MTVCVVGALIISTLLAMHWPFADGLTSISALVTIYVWFYVIFWFAVQVNTTRPRLRQHTSMCTSLTSVKHMSVSETSLHVASV
jgi:hypothetical protein